VGGESEKRRLKPLPHTNSHCWAWKHRLPTERRYRNTPTQSRDGKHNYVKGCFAADWAGAANCTPVYLCDWESVSHLPV